MKNKERVEEIITIEKIRKEILNNQIFTDPQEQSILFYALEEYESYHRSVIQMVNNYSEILEMEGIEHDDIVDVPSIETSKTSFGDMRFLESLKENEMRIIFLIQKIDILPDKNLQEVLLRALKYTLTEIQLDLRRKENNRTEYGKKNS